jgi:hypothetical protein
MQNMTVADVGINTKQLGIKDKDRKKEMLESLEIDALELLEGKMNHIALEHFYKQVCSKSH